MALLPRTIIRRALLAGTACVVLSLAAATVAMAHSGHPASISATVDGMSVQVSGTWSWTAEASDPVPSYIGYALSWGDVSSGNDVGPYHIGDGTAATNVVRQPTSPAQGSSGTWGPVSHVYAAAGTYTICSIIYDLGEVKPFPATGQESLVAGGPDGNPDNSVDNGATPGARCATVTVAAAATATATPSTSQVVAGATFVAGPTSSPPPTSTLGSSDVPGGGGILLALILVALSALGAAAVSLHAQDRPRM